MNTINLSCHTCKRVIEVSRDHDAPKEATGIECNWCPNCEGDMVNSYYEEKYTYDEPKQPVYDNPNQLKMF